MGRTSRAGKDIIAFNFEGEGIVCFSCAASMDSRLLPPLTADDIDEDGCLVIDHDVVPLTDNDLETLFWQQDNGCEITCVRCGNVLEKAIQEKA